MSTRSFIGIHNDDGSYSVIYCHWDGYIRNGVGLTLVGYYDNEEKIRDLLKLGDLSTLGRSTLTSEAYHRDRGEVLNPPRIFQNETELLNYFKESDCNYLYIFEDDRWIFRKHYYKYPEEDDGEWSLIEDFL